MRRILTSLAVFACCAAVAQQEYTAKINPQLKGYAFLDFPFPNNLTLSDLDRNQTTLRIEGLTLIQIWGTCCGVDAGNWDRIQELPRRYAERGLTTISVNFENGFSGRAMRQNLKDFFTMVEKPERLYYDALGASVDLLRVPGFPAFYLVEPDGTVVFRTNGKDSEGLAILEGEIERRLAGGE